jgi:hypothetical protein
LFDRWRRKQRPVAVVDPPGYRRSPGVIPPPPAADPYAPMTDIPAPAAKTGPAVRLMMADGTVESLPADPELEARAAYLVRSMLSPPPPPPPTA